MQRVEFTMEFLIGVTPSDEVVYFYEPKNGDVNWSPHQSAAQNIHSKRSHLAGEEDGAEVTDTQIESHVAEKVRAISGDTVQYSQFKRDGMPMPDSIQLICTSFVFVTCED